MNILILKVRDRDNDNTRLIAYEITELSSLSLYEEVLETYQYCLDCVDETENEEKITVIYNGQIHEFLPERQLQEFFKTI